MLETAPVGRAKIRKMRTSACLLIIALAVPAFSQVRDNVTVELIEVPVYVTAADGQAVRGLTKGDFELRVDGKVQPIEYFEAIDFAQPAQRIAAPRPARERRLYLLLFDGNYTIPARLERAQRAADFALERSNLDTDLFAVATYTSNKGLQFATPFVSDRVAIRRALSTLSTSSVRDPLGLAMSDVERATWTMPEEAAVDALAAEMGEALRGGAAYQDLIEDQSRHRLTDQLRDFTDLAHRLSGLQGQKHVVYFSSTLPAALIHGGATPVPTSPLSGGGLDAAAMRDFKELCLAFAGAGVFIDAVDVDGLRHQQGKIEPFNSDEGLQMVAHNTGGTYISHRNDFGPALNEMLTAQKNVYVLAFNRRSNRSGTITVRVNGVPRSTRVSYRPGFGDGTPSKNVDPLQLADILIHNVPQSGLNLLLKAVPKSLEITVPREEIFAQVAEGAVVDALFYVFDGRGTAVFGKEQRVAVTRGDGPLHIAEPISLPPGRYTAKVITRIEGTTSLGFARAAFTIE